MGAKQPVSHTEHLHICIPQYLGLQNMFGLLRGGLRAWKCSWPYLGGSSHGDNQSKDEPWTHVVRFCIISFEEL
eukprot:1158933-Pelagomonas_calceolata.AAC.3